MDRHNLNTNAKPSLYLHISLDGAVYTLQSDALIGSWIDAVELKELLKGLEKNDGSIFVSSDYIDESSESDASLIFELIDSFSVEVHAVDPHPAVQGYHKSYISYINSAINVSEMDIEGTEQLLADAQDMLDEALEEDPEYAELKGERDKLQNQLEFARYAHQKLLELELDICTEIKAVIQ